MKTDEIKRQIEEAGYDYAVAIATEAEINANAACGQLGLIEELDPTDAKDGGGYKDKTGMRFEKGA